MDPTKRAWICCSNAYTWRRELVRLVKGQVRSSGIEIHETVADLAERLRDRRDRVVLILVAESPAMLASLLSIQDLMEDVPIILILPPWDEELLRAAHKLIPRYISQGGADLADVSMVLGNLLKRSRGNGARILKASKDKGL